MKVKFSDFDRVICAQAQREVPWQGTEDVVSARYALGEALQLVAFTKAKAGTPLEKLSRELSFTAELSREQLELLIAIVAGGGQAVKGDVGPILGELVTRLRKAAPRKDPNKEPQQ